MKPRPLHRINETYESGALKLLLSRKDKSVSDEECEKTDQTSRDISPPDLVFMNGGTLAKVSLL